MGKTRVGASAKAKRLHLDFGNSFIKWLAGGSWGSLRHAIVQLRANEWDAIIARGVPALDREGGYIKVKGIPYAVGSAARRHLIPERPRGAARYVETYYGVGLCYALALAYTDFNDRDNTDLGDVELVASYAPQDVDYVRDLKAAARGRWTFEARGKRYTLSIAHTVRTLDEPLAGFTNAVYAFARDGRLEEPRNNPFALGATLVIDVGGYTTDYAAIDEGGSIDMSSLGSRRLGALGALETFEYELRSNNAKMFKGVGDIDVNLIDRAIRTGEFAVGKHTIDCRREADAALNPLANSVSEIIGAMGGYINYRNILLTGGGCALIYDRLQTVLPLANFRLADNLGEMMYANVRGLEKAAILIETEIA